MINNKGQSKSGIIIGVIIFVVALISVGVIAMIIVGSGKSSNNEEVIQPELINFYLKAIDERTNEQVRANYKVEYNNSIISEGILFGDSFTELKTPIDTLIITCWGDKYYFGRTFKFFSGIEIDLNSSKGNCRMDKMGELEISHKGKIKEEISSIVLNLTTEDNYRKLKICTSWTQGIISVIPKENEIMCDEGNWFNWSLYNKTNAKYTMLPETYYRCGECEGAYCDWTERCESIKGRSCKLYTMKTPERYIGKIDSCYYTGKSLDNESFSIEYLVRTDNPNPLDEVTFYIMDSDRRFDPGENLLRYMTELGGKNLGSEPDYNYTIKYGN